MKVFRGKISSKNLEKRPFNVLLKTLDDCRSFSIDTRLLKTQWDICTLLVYIFWNK